MIISDSTVPVGERPLAVPPGVDADSYDGDLAWILERLDERAGATFGTILRFAEGSEGTVVLARHAASLDLPVAAFERLCDVLQPRPCELARRSLEQTPQKLSLDLRPCGAAPVRVLYLRFMPATGVVIVVAICRPEASFNLLHELVAARLHPVLDRYLRLWWMHRTECRRAAIFQRTIDESELGVILLDRQARLRYANACSRRLLDRRDGLRQLGAAVGPVRIEELLRFQRAVQVAILRNRRSQGAGSAGSTLLAVSREGKRSLIVSVVAVDRPAIDPEDAAAVLHILDPEHDFTGLLEPAFRIYRLTGAEARLVASLVGGADLATAAASMNLAVHTARSYLKQVFLKTATNRQSDLVRVMCRSAARAAVSGDLQQL